MYYGLFLISWFTLRLFRKKTTEPMGEKNHPSDLLRKGDKSSWDIF